MKKDDRLEREFDAYFDGVTPPDDATDSAKKLIKKKARNKILIRSLVPTFATVAAVCGIAVLAVNIVGRFSVDSNPPTTPNAPSAPEIVYSYYTTDTLTKSALNAYSTTLPTELEIVKKLELSRNAAVTDFCAYTDDNGAVSLVRADVCVTANGYRHDTTIYVEYTPERTVYEPLKSFYDGYKLNRDGALLSHSENNGERVYNLLAYDNGVRYYISVESADARAYQYYLQII